MNKRERLAQLKAQLTLDIQRAAEIARLEEELANRPTEPPVDAVVAFVKDWGPGVRSGKQRTYNYVAYQAVGGWWYLSQSNYRDSGQPRMLWDELLDFINGADIFIATAWEQLT